ncbi:RusA family crossover junction endodeoxyribonuclease [Buttiauxella sp. 3AFRM03]|uniref:crossover junction endodeoxyribonuclease RusA n=1 Tax=Buttiauxella sp. 3AFRM03 TaxID=2479367 RepID=UPI000EF7FE12|nr:crossover junction endodeoxyribonuclease RusA [Buttiauxella sp. 3AFRM03]AYN25754.1 RusA family crossover junction endodeoxyribonuclease [Buttiauxella sp. 3AFRM03]
MKSYQLILPWPPSNNRYWRHSRGRHYISEWGKRYRKEVIQIIQAAKLDISITPRIKVTIHAAPPDNRKRDLDNLPKAVFDALTSAGFWLDDGQIDDMRIKRCQRVLGGQLVLVIRETTGELPSIKDISEAA